MKCHSALFHTFMTQNRSPAEKNRLKPASGSLMVLAGLIWSSYSANLSSLRLAVQSDGLPV